MQMPLPEAILMLTVLLFCYLGQPATAAVLTTRNDKCPSDLMARKRLVCYYRIEDDFRPYDLDPCLCTHIVYSYVAVKENFAFIAGKKGKLPVSVSHGFSADFFVFSF